MSSSENSVSMEATNSEDEQVIWYSVSGWHMLPEKCCHLTHCYCPSYTTSKGGFSVELFYVQLLPHLCKCKMPLRKYLYRMCLTLCIIIRWPTIFQMVN
jgi:hypothetical protein